MQQYELTLIFNPGMSEEDADAVVDDLKLSVVHRQVWGKRLMAYPIKKQKEGLYIHLVIELDSARVAELDQKLRLNENVLRHLLVVAENHMAAA